MPLDLLKMDPALLRQVPDDRASVIILRALVQLTHGLDLEVMAEGVETEGQLRLLRAVRCDGVQGFHTGHPAPHAPLIRLLEGEDLNPVFVGEGV